MYRTMRVMMALFALGLVISSLTAQQSGGLNLGEKLEGELTANSKKILVAQNDWHFSTEMLVSLKAGQSISISATVIGKDRLVTLFLADPTGKNLANSRSTGKTGQLNFEEVSATGKYTIMVGSNLIGPFTLRVTDPSNADGDIKALETRIEQLRKELAAAESKLKALKENSRGRLSSPLPK